MSDQECNFLHVEKVAGNGYATLILHGWGHSLAQVKPLGQLLAPTCDVHLVDLPGFGRSTPPPTVWSAWDYADRIIAYCDEKQLHQIDLIGHSFGGKVAICMALKYPQRVRRLALIGASGLKRHRPALQRLRMVAIKMVGKFIKLIDHFCGLHLFVNYFSNRFGSPDYRQASGVMRAILVRSVNEDLSNVVHKIVQPTCLLWGELDTETPLEVAYRLHANIKGSKLYLLKYQSHQAFLDMGAHLCAYHLLPFLQDDDLDSTDCREP